MSPDRDMYQLLSPHVCLLRVSELRAAVGRATFAKAPAAPAVAAAAAAGAGAVGSGEEGAAGSKPAKKTFGGLYYTAEDFKAEHEGLASPSAYLEVAGSFDSDRYVCEAATSLCVIVSAVCQEHCGIAM